MNNATAVTKLHFNKRALTLVTPAGILMLVVLISIIIALAIQRAGVDPGSPDYISGFQQSNAVLGSVTGFLVYLGVQSVATTFPFGMSLGTTRRAYTLGTVLFFLVQSAYVAVVSVILLGIELLTGHWFADAYVFDAVMMGSGNPAKLAAIMFLVTFAALSVGAVFGALYVKAGTKGPLILALSLGVVLALGVLLLTPYFAAIFASGVLVKLLGFALILALVANVGTYITLRGTSVR